MDVHSLGLPVVVDDVLCREMRAEGRGVSEGVLRAWLWQLENDGAPAWPRCDCSCRGRCCPDYRIVTDTDGTFLGTQALDPRTGEPIPLRRPGA